MWNAGLDKAQAGIKIAGGNINNLRYTDDTIFMAECKEELKSLLMKVKKESEKACLKLMRHSKNEDHVIQSHYFMASKWGKSGNSDRFLFSWAPKSLLLMTSTRKLKDACFLEENLWQT